ncbi:YhcN/YlaJ family sporulation lipoprotein [Oceanobacillus massiliensis]|uniref:YhcN/YlaJ family sporulation lipoprotein n=1 Tax=Oceanobacillus massiliensis TaxID=1465765 RepID=UPI0002895B89|nr:YhcN/YlaJ family sporulation lipoprotein [Oceanobacillus massiliensis]
MLNKLLLSLMLILLLAAGCTNGERTQQTSDINDGGSIQPIHFDRKDRDIYNKDESSIGEQGGYPQSEQKMANDADFSNYTDAYTNEESIRISEELQQRKDIIQAQVASTDDRIIVAVMLQERFNLEVPDVEEYVREIVPDTDKEIIVYTDEIHWDRMKNLDARLGAKNSGEGVEKFIEDLFQLND